MIFFTDEMREELINFLKNNLDIPSNGVWAHYYEDGYEDDDWYEDFGYDCGADYIEHGASKAVLFYSDFPSIVVKIPFCGEYIEDEDKFKDFEHSNLYFPIEESNNYCAGEAYITNQSFYVNLEKMFALTYFLFECNGTPIYISEKIPNSRWSNPRWHDKDYSLSIAQDIKTCRNDELTATCLDEEVIALFVDAYGEEKTYELIDFIVEHNIRDLHNGNIGFTKDMKIKILDYSGFDS